MIEVTTATPIYYFLMEFAKLVYAAFPIMVIFIGMSFIIGSIRPEPWGGSIYGLGIISGIAFIIVGILLAVIL